MIKHLPLTDEYRQSYENAAVLMLKSLIDDYASHNEEEDGILLHSVYVHFANKGVDEFCLWGDYFYFEALVRMLKSWNLYW